MTSTLSLIIFNRVFTHTGFFCKKMDFFSDNQQYYKNVHIESHPLSGQSSWFRLHENDLFSIKTLTAPLRCVVFSFPLFPLPTPSFYFSSNVFSLVSFSRSPSLLQKCRRAHGGTRCLTRTLFFIIFSFTLIIFYYFFSVRNETF